MAAAVLLMVAGLRVGETAGIRVRGLDGIGSTIPCLCPNNCLPSHFQAVFFAFFVFFVVACTVCEHQSEWGTQTMGRRSTYRAWRLP